MPRWMQVRVPLPERAGPRFDRTRFGRTILEQAVLEHYRAGLLTGSAAARMLGVSRAGFLDFLGARKVPYFGGQHDDQADLADAEDLADTLSGR